MVNIKHLIHKECAKHDVSSVTVESLIARLLVARAVYHSGTGQGIWKILVGWHSGWQWNQRLVDRAIDMITDVDLDKDKVLLYVQEYTRVCRQQSKR